ncbi:thioredoxin-domain-containing protein [Lentithecium fluviatile CBS 122367]|uniref:Thioredoxin-domain-containing protein n=1 Tax=Lentithecium fluviatile CBS 122367 TaxID=1168545 RepID=A0A6G1IDB9_9PLEO|nr:thioredoxin-domain-containing protein [Lentithecium fluviatile CBS 122367]
MPTEITAPLHFRTLLTSHTYLIADFYATWCPPCKAIAPIFAQLSDTHSAPGKIAFVKVNVDEQQEVAAQYGIQAMPTFLVFREGKKIEEIKGAKPPALKGVVERIVGEVGREKEKGEGGKKVKETKVEDKKVGEGEERTVSGSYGMTGGQHWKMSLT